MLDLASATRIHNRSEMSHQPLDGHDLLPTLRRKDHLPPDNLPAIGFSCVAPGLQRRPVRLLLRPRNLARLRDFGRFRRAVPLLPPARPAAREATLARHRLAQVITGS